MKIKVSKTSETPNSWIFTVSIDIPGNSCVYEVTLDREHHVDLTSDSISPLELIQRSIMFLLDRESPQAILRSFNIHEITTYFPEYGEFIRSTLKD